jgi:hypothetical protein
LRATTIGSASSTHPLDATRFDEQKRNKLFVGSDKFGNEEMCILCRTLGVCAGDMGGVAKAS